MTAAFEAALCKLELVDGTTGQLSPSQS